MSGFFGSTAGLLRSPALPSCPARGTQPLTVCMAKKKGVRTIVTLECTEARKLGLTPSRYTTQKNKRTTTGRMELKKYNPYLQRHTVHREIK